MQEIRVGGRALTDALEALKQRRAVLVLAMVASLVTAVLFVAVAARPAPLIAPPARSGASDASTPSYVPGIWVHVAGAVRSPGLYEIPTESRVADAIEAAGGPTGRADLDALNLAQQVIDGSQVLVPRRGDRVSASASSAPVEAAPAPVSLNAADPAQLETIPGVGPVTAAAIIRFRTENGGFDSIEQLLDVTGIGPATLESLRPYVSL